MKIALINPSFFPVVPNIGLAYLASSIEKNHTVKLLDLGFRYKDYQEYIRCGIEEFKPDIAGISVLTPNYFIALDIAKLIKRIDPHISILFGGVHCTLEPETTIKHPLIDAVCIGEGEEAISEYLDKLEHGLEPKVRGIWYKDKKGNIIKNNARPFHNDLNVLTFPNWDYFDVQRYSGMGDYYPNSLVHIYSRGCPYNCTFCTNPAIAKAVPGQYYRTRNSQNMIAEIKMNYDKYKGWFKNIFFMDEIFGLDKGSFEEFCGAFIAADLNRKLSWTCQTRADVITSDWAKNARNANCTMVCLGIESGDEELRRGVLRKDVSDEDILRAVKSLEEFNIPYKFTFILGFPGETKKAAEKSFLVARKFNPIRSDFLYYQPFPHVGLSHLIAHTDNFFCNLSKNKKKAMSDGMYVWTKIKLQTNEFNRNDIIWVMNKIRLFKVAKFLNQGLKLRGAIFIFDILKFILSINNYRNRPLSHPAIFGELYQKTVSKYILENICKKIIDESPAQK